MKTITVVCFANYCRSPVVEKVLKKKYNENYNFISAGIKPIFDGGMDKRSSLFLNSIGISEVQHSPKKINKALVEESDLIFAIDTMVLAKLNADYSGHKKKIKLLTYQNPRIRLQDPFNMNNEDYLFIMEKLQNICNDLKL